MEFGKWVAENYDSAVTNEYENQRAHSPTTNEVVSLERALEVVFQQEMQLELDAAKLNPNSDIDAWNEFLSK